MYNYHLVLDRIIWQEIEEQVNWNRLACKNKVATIHIAVFLKNQKLYPKTDK